MTSTATWTPRCSVDEADKIITRSGSLFEIENRVVDGRALKVWKNLWPSAREFFLKWTKKHADKTYVVYEKQRFSFQEMLEMAVKCAAMFRDVYGVKKGDRVVICSRNLPSYYVVFWACHLLGAVTALVNACLSIDRLRRCIMLTKCRLVIFDPERADDIEPIAADIKRVSGIEGYLVLEDHEGKGRWEGMDVWSKVFLQCHKDPGEILRDNPHIVPEDNATIIFTSGTTGLPKGVLSSQRAFLTLVLTSMSLTARGRIRRGEPFPPLPVSGPQKGALISSPLFYISGITLSLLGTCFGLKLILMRKWNAHEAIREENIVLTGSAPSLLIDLLDSPSSGLTLENVGIAGAPVSPTLLQRTKEAFPLATIRHLYALTETNATSVSFGGNFLSKHLVGLPDDVLDGPDFLAKPDSCGFVSPVNEILIMKGHVRAAPGEVGEVWLRGPNVMKGYYEDQAATDRVYKMRIPSIFSSDSFSIKVLTKDGWLMTGDLGYVDEEGYVYIKDRIEDMIFRAGESIDPISVENALYTEPAVLEAAAVSVPDDRLCQLVTALVTLKPGYHGKISEKKLLETARKLLPQSAVPVMIILKDGEFDHTPSGKIIKVQLRAIAQEEWIIQQDWRHQASTNALEIVLPHQTVILSEERARRGKNLGMSNPARRISEEPAGSPTTTPPGRHGSTFHGIVAMPHMRLSILACLARILTPPLQNQRHAHTVLSMVKERVVAGVYASRPHVVSGYSTAFRNF
ncbi:uncharacterized protein EV420DRAFT_1645404 [Desarmillaria tabescens]|uniref:Acetyl-CoA synthetase-like protein n=1 Tax=Armillaria tabescens TaxID=1929756 RepID=A0AA39K3Q5_ARMTA|nr:uncharacterized protein EV420DRAFT_1645404 [Desarmillaria tabescens]KAK0452880.1 hypothetical protein EV420DRAFT_1645404 [Desarmillaria tabescens]